ncbi:MULTISPECIES: holo-ACP synthase [Methanohalophilus]|jgi:phosphopantetheine--protein transferase-like protein|uniref:4'-phosphopantetheinyl transferase superfamily protein n=1 Tax=Methanohalophilus euhalobius TaxID=51203 RepID=A0A314ZTV2_9EURY|nr:MULTISPECIES: 4'-phosphopantetheinyl transferase superfamily protein [Methanohalophilus]OBZ34805.1 MAG: hypothetical protein A9957_09555 [Methanohalophilus sp. DAL1]PQV41834.1 holo-[acyl-carrier-protein] synthase [Methanohalophilus euhalobius]RNI07238.1 4'-phosphopantetheinyl transferase superfamily protein [Methanohalophilus euhalobius]
MNIGIGVDIDDISRFEEIKGNKPFLMKFLSTQELKYCYSKTDPTPHIAVRFVGKEAVIKALYNIGICDVFFKDVHILN